MDLPIRFCRTKDGVRIAYATLGQGPPLVCPPWSVTHLETLWESSAARAFFERLGRHHTVVLMDRWGCGLSERDRSDFTLEADVRSLEAVIDDLKLKRFAFCGFSTGGPIAIAYLAKHPRHVTHLVLIGTWANGDRLAPDEVKTSFVSFLRSAWGLGVKALTDLMIPEADAETRAWFARAQQTSATAEMAANLLGANYDFTVTDLLPAVHVPTVVIHRRHERAVRLSNARELAAGIRGSRLVVLEGIDNLPWFEDQESVLRAILEFLGDPIESETEAARLEGVAGTSGSAAGGAVFISYATEDQRTAEAVLRALEGAGISCWIAPRDIPPGQDYAEAIVQAIRRSRLMVVVFSSHANRSPHVRREVERAASADLPIVPLRVEDVTPSAAMEYFLSTPHWLNAFPGPLEPLLEQLTSTARNLLDRLGHPAEA